MQNMYDKNALLDKISKMTIYEKDYATIRNILRYTEPELAAAIIEEVINGNLYWTDFEKIMPSEYGTLLSSSLENQKNITTELRRLVKFRKWTNSGYTSQNQYLEDALFPIGITQAKDDNGEPTKRWLDEYKKQRDDLMYFLTSVNSNDNTITLVYKERLLNAIENGKAIFDGEKGITVNSDGSVDLTRDFKKQFINSDDDNILNNVIAVIKNGYIVIYNTNGKKYKSDWTELGSYLYINPNDILFSVDPYVIPVDYRYQTVEAVDKVYMESNNCTEDDIKKMKSLYLWIKYSGEYKDSSEDKGDTNV